MQGEEGRKGVLNYLFVVDDICMRWSASRKKAGGFGRGGDATSGRNLLPPHIDIYILLPTILRTFPFFVRAIRSIDSFIVPPPRRYSMKYSHDDRQELHRPINAISDYSEAIRYLEGPDGDKADPDELPASR